MTPRFELHEDDQRLSLWGGVSVASLLPNRPGHDDSGRRLHPVLRLSSATHNREFVWMREGLIPSYACDDRGAEQRSEAHAESMTCDSCFRSAFRRRRCLIPADVLHESRHLASGINQPCSFSLESGEIFGIAGVWETWTNDQGHTVESFAIVTALVTPVLRTLFDRMPVVLTNRKEQEQWLYATKEEPPVDLLHPISASDLRAWHMTPGAVSVQFDQVALASAQAR